MEIDNFNIEDWKQKGEIKKGDLLHNVINLMAGLRGLPVALEILQDQGKIDLNSNDLALCDKSLLDRMKTYEETCEKITEYLYSL